MTLEERVVALECALFGKADVGVTDALGQRLNDLSITMVAVDDQVAALANTIAAETDRRQADILSEAAQKTS